jgi:hypothetical protein
MPDTDGARPEVIEAVAQARRAVTAGLALWREGLIAESHVYMAEALRTAVGAWSPADDIYPSLGLEAAVASAPSPDGPALSALVRAGYPSVDRLRAALAVPSSAVGGAARPELDWIWDEIERLCRFTLRRLTPTRTRRLRRLYGGATLAALVIVAVLIAVNFLGAPSVTASGSYPLEAHPPSYALDGMAASEWLLPDGTPGWLEIAFRSPRRVHSVRLLNSHNRYFMDRASERVRVIAFSDQWPVATAEGRFDRINIERSALDLPLDAEKVTRLRVEILSYFRTGGGLAEIEVH